MGVDPAYETHTEPDPEKALALAVIQRAILDHVAPGADMTFADRRDAKLFLFAKGGPWAASRRAWCAVADIDEGWLHRRVRAIIDGEASIESGQGRSLKRARAARPGPKPRVRWDAQVLDWMRANRHLPGHERRDKAGLLRVLEAAGFRAPRGGPLTTDTVYYLIERNAEAFAG